MKEDVEKHRRRENLNQKLEENDELAMKKSIRFGLIRASLLNKTNLDDNSVEYRIRIDKTDIDKSSPEDIIEVDEARFSSSKFKLIFNLALYRIQLSIRIRFRFIQSILLPIISIISDRNFKAFLVHHS